MPTGYEATLIRKHIIAAEHILRFKFVLEHDRSCALQSRAIRRNGHSKVILLR